MTQHEATTGASPDAVELITVDHRAVEQLYKQFTQAKQGSEVATHLKEAIIRELSVHAVIEEKVLYPAIRGADGGEALVEHSLDEHQEVKELLAQLDRPDVHSDEAIRLMDQVMASVRHHVEEEESKVLPFARKAFDPEKLHELGRALEEARTMAPTRPHPNAPSSPPGNLIAGPVAAVIDRARDAARDMMRTT